MPDKKCVAENWSHALQKTRSSSTPLRPSPLKSTDRYRPARGLRLCGNPFIHTQRREAAIGHAINEAATAYRPLLHFRIKRSIRPGSGLGTAGHVIVNSLVSRRRLASRRPPGRTFDKLKKNPSGRIYLAANGYSPSFPSPPPPLSPACACILAVGNTAVSHLRFFFFIRPETPRKSEKGKARGRGGGGRTQNYWPTKFFNSRVSGMREIPLRDLSPLESCLWKLHDLPLLSIPNFRIE